ncbi:hypothetical protein TGME49_219620 [Toxoplasma gondii ME49]|uniref:Ribosomal RNA methyltransferase FtsJ domain-containing protein n=1 Tax=Toxoplasma gondii (strain ATCC 50611 / Me49) TaxID=508771 RepID=S8FZE3_TOXGM|nr:hypothetical protein TGME49_219620 [Toxoplasma gondii ME49]EPT24595.1 hypothetical protein TGME49_219620 [Toxoplasma gondii ME49]|eukprot:XP_018634796.1 hypothetical protein TGME49_219620 [Toxoplasma gondii ME49]
MGGGVWTRSFLLPSKSLYVSFFLLFVAFLFCLTFGLPDVGASDSQFRRPLDMTTHPLSLSRCRSARLSTSKSSMNCASLSPFSVSTEIPTHAPLPSSTCALCPSFLLVPVASPPFATGKLSAGHVEGGRRARRPVHRAFSFAFSQPFASEEHRIRHCCYSAPRSPPGVNKSAISKRIRADDLLIQRGLADTKSQAASLILLGRVAISVRGKARKNRQTKKSTAEGNSTETDATRVCKEEQTSASGVHSREEADELQSAISMLSHSSKEPVAFVPHQDRLKAWHRVISSGRYRILTKAGEVLRLDEADPPSVLLHPQPRFVNRAGEKLEAFLASLSSFSREKRTYAFSSSVPTSSSSAFPASSSPSPACPSDLVSPSLRASKTSDLAKIPVVGRKSPAHEEAEQIQREANTKRKLTAAKGDNSETETEGQTPDERGKERTEPLDVLSERGLEIDLPAVQQREEGSECEKGKGCRENTALQVNVQNFEEEKREKSASGIFSLEGKTVLDVGSSTGGFTDCCLQRGVHKVVCVDVGKGELHATLRSDPRVVAREGVNAR